MLFDGVYMRKSWSSARDRGFVRAVASCLLVLLVFFSAALAVSSAHSRSHQSSPGAPDQCVFCLFAHGQILADGPATDVLVVPTGAVRAVLVSDGKAPADFDYRLSPSRAPPACFS